MRRDVLKPFAKKSAFVEDRVQSGIEANRKGYAFLHLQGADGKPVAGADVKVTQLTHDFKYGANLFMLDEFPSDEQNQAYRQLFAEAFNIATLPFYWNALEPEQGKPRFAKDSPKVYRRPAPDLCLEYCEANGIEPKAHCLNYAFFTPAWARGEVNQEKRLLDKRFRELAERYAGRIPSWEVTNEAYWGLHRQNFPNFYDQPDFVEWSFAAAQRHFPTNRLIVNDGGFFAKSFFHGNRSRNYMLVERAIRNGARIDTIGMQYHQFHSAEEELEKTCYDPETLYEVMDCYAALGRNLQITEITIPAYTYTAEDEEIQAEILRHLYGIWFSHPAMEAIIYWNLIDGFAHGTPPGDMTGGENHFRGGLLRYDFAPKPSYTLIKELFGKTWRTNLKLQTQTDELCFKGFYGTYRLDIDIAGQTVSRQFHLDKQQKRHHLITLD